MTPRSPDLPSRRRPRRGLVLAPLICLVLAACTLHATTSHAASCLAGALSGWTGKSRKASPG